MVSRARPLSLARWAACRAADATPAGRGLAQNGSGPITKSKHRACGRRSPSSEASGASYPVYRAHRRRSLRRSAARRSADATLPGQSEGAAGSPRGTETGYSSWREVEPSFDQQAPAPIVPDLRLQRTLSNAADVVTSGYRRRMRYRSACPRTSLCVPPSTDVGPATTLLTNHPQIVCAAAAA